MFLRQATGKRSFFLAGLVLSVLLASFQKGLEKIILERKKESMCSARWLVSVWPNRMVGALIHERKYICDCYNMFTYYVENSNHTDKWRNILFACMQWIISRRIERMPLENRWNIWPTTDRSVHSQRCKKQGGKMQPWHEKTTEKVYDMVL